MISFLSQTYVCFPFSRPSASCILLVSKQPRSLCIQNHARYVRVSFAEDTFLAQQKPVPLPCQGSSPRSQVQGFKMLPSAKFFCQSIVGNPESPAKESVQASSPQDSALAICHEWDPQVPNQRPQGLRMWEGITDHPAPYPICPSYQSTRDERHQVIQGQVTRWD